ncbi:branched-chain amino acid ABC transporter permease [Gryllotalpicola ginsengisoli]|uniref:branched-chain amino acid ABC transporter permease n=1 Tax=Gryllotalpicola ginsengisoli TaxID=444608 RepID=UPI0004823EFC|nr:branched-chain amino acid ABC transporter permease [Gryllotalpicola ginsengisoli]
MDWTFLPLTLNQIISPQTIAYALAALGLTVHFGYSGLLNFGQAGFMSVGAYFFAITATRFGFPLWASVLAALVGSTAFAFLLGIPTLRLRADYLSIVTIAAAEIIRYTVQTPNLTALTGGSDGINGSEAGFEAINPIPDRVYKIGVQPYTNDDLWVIIVGWVLVGAAALFVWQLMRSPWGRIVKGIREDEDAVRALGKNVYSFKMQALIIGGVLGTLGAIINILPTSLQPDNYGTQTTFFLWTIMLLGGATTVLGPIIGAIIFWVVLSLSDGFIAVLSTANIVPLSQVQQGPVRFIIVGVALMLLVVFRPQGIFGKKKEAYFSA